VDELIERIEATQEHIALADVFDDWITGDIITRSWEAAR
jgi:hypothetical protein